MNQRPCSRHKFFSSGRRSPAPLGPHQPRLSIEIWPTQTFFFHKAGATQLHSAHTSPSCQLKCTHKTKKWRRQTLEQTPQRLTTRLRTLLCLLSHFKYFVYLTIDPSILWTMYTLIFAKSNLTFISTLNIHKMILWQFLEFLKKF